MINRRPYWNYTNYRDYKIELTGGHIGIMLIIEIAKIELTGRHIIIMLIIDIAKMINRRPYWNYTNYRDYKIELTGGHIGIIRFKEFPKLQLTGGHIGIMLIIEISKIEITGGHIGFC